MATRIRVNRAGIRKLLTAPEVEADLLRRGQNIARAAGPGHEADIDPDSPNRARVNVRTATPEAMVSEAGSRTLTRAIDAGRR